MLYALSFGALLAVTLLHQAAALPSPWLWPCLAGAGLLLALGLPRTLRGLAVAFVGGAILWGARAHYVSAQQLAAQLATVDEKTPLLAAVDIIDIPQHSPQRTRVLVRLVRPLSALPTGTRLLLSQHHKPHARPPPLAAGERWHMTVSLKRPHGPLNAGGPDREAWLWSEGIRATGTIRNAVRLGRAPGWHARLAAVRERLALRIRTQLQGKPSAGLITALVVGDSSEIPWRQTKEVWSEPPREAPPLRGRKKWRILREQSNLVWRTLQERTSGQVSLAPNKISP